MEEKIIQIIPAPNNLFVVDDYDSEEEGENALCLALTDQGNILIMNTVGTGEVGIVTNVLNFEYVFWK